MLKNLKNKKKKGFTLVELVVVIAIIAILAAVLVPQITGYIENSRKTEVIQEAREIITAVESVSATTGTDVTGALTIDGGTVTSNNAVGNLVSDIRTIPTGTSVEQLRQVLNSEKYTFKLKKVDGVYQLNTENGSIAPIS